MSRLDSIFNNFESVFAGVTVAKHPLDNEQAAPFSVPTPEEVSAMRAGVEAVKQRNRATARHPLHTGCFRPTPPWRSDHG